jgi:hypothetical protein
MWSCYLFVDTAISILIEYLKDFAEVLQIAFIQFEHEPYWAAVRFLKNKLLKYKH